MNPHAHICSLPLGRVKSPFRSLGGLASFEANRQEAP